MTTILNGLLGGLVVGAIAAAVTVFVASRGSGGDARPASEDAGGSGWRRFLVWLLYGTVAGALLVALELYVLDVLSVPPSVTAAFGVAAAWSALLFGALAVGRYLAGSGTDLAHRLRAPLVFHLVLAVGLGAWIRLTWIT